MCSNSVWQLLNPELRLVEVLLLFLSLVQQALTT